MIKKTSKLLDRRHHNVYVVYLRNPNGDGKAGLCRHDGPDPGAEI